MVLVAVEASPVGSKPLAAVRMRIFAGESQGFGAAAPLSTRASSLEQGRAGGPMKSSPKLVRRIGWVSPCAEELSPLVARSAAAAPSIRLRVLVSVGASASVARHGRHVSCSVVVVVFSH